MQKNTKQTRNYSRILVIFAAIVSVTAISLTIYTHGLVSSGEKTTNDQIMHLQYGSARNRFCHDNQIVPCDDASINTWNNEHPGDAFSLAQ